jgi:hypothetical protein
VVGQYVDDREHDWSVESLERGTDIVAGYSSNVTSSLRRLVIDNSAIN